MFDTHFKTSSMKTQNTLRTTISVSLKSTLLLLLFLSFSSCNLQAQSTERTVTGIVKSLDGPVPFATIMLKGTTIGISADEQGAFTFPKRLQENDVLIASSLGYKDGEVIIKKDTQTVTPFLEDIPLIIVASLRTKPSTTQTQSTCTNK